MTKLSWKVDWMQPGITTRDGRNVRILCVDAPGDRPVVGVLDNGDLYRWGCNGCLSLSGTRLSDLDLMPPKRKGTLWINVYANPLYVYTYASREDADRGAGYDRMACLEINWEEGQGL